MSQHYLAALTAFGVPIARQLRRDTNSPSGWSIFQAENMQTIPAPAEAFVYSGAEVACIAARFFPDYKGKRPDRLPPMAACMVKDLK